METIPKDINQLKAEILLLQNRYKVLGDFFRNCSSNSKKIYDIRIVENSGFHNQSVEVFFNAALAIPVVVKSSGLTFKSTDNNHIDPKDKFFLFYALGFNNILSTQESLVTKLNRVEKVVRLTTKKSSSGHIETTEATLLKFSEDLQAVFNALKEDQISFHANCQLKSGFGGKHEVQAYAIKECARGKFSIFYPRARHLKETEFFNFLKTTSEQFKKYTVGLINSSTALPKSDELNPGKEKHLKAIFDEEEVEDESPSSSSDVLAAPAKRTFDAAISIPPGQSVFLNASGININIETTTSDEKKDHDDGYQMDVETLADDHHETLVDEKKDNEKGNIVAAALNPPGQSVVLSEATVDEEKDPGVCNQMNSENIAAFPNLHGAPVIHDLETSAVEKNVHDNCNQMDVDNQSSQQNIVDGSRIQMDDLETRADEKMEQKDVGDVDKVEEEHIDEVNTAPTIRNSELVGTISSSVLGKRPSSSAVTNRRKSRVVVDDDDDDGEEDDDGDKTMSFSTQDLIEKFQFSELVLNPPIAARGEVMISSSINSSSFSSSSSMSIESFNPNEVIHDCLMNLLDKKYHIATLEFQLSMEMILRYTQYKQPFWQFMLMCESIAVEFTKKKITDDPTKDFQLTLNFAQSQLDTISWDMMTFVKHYVKHAKIDDMKNILSHVYKSIDGALLDKYSAILSSDSVIAAISNISREDDLFARLSASKTLKNARLELLSGLASRFCHDSSFFLKDNKLAAKEIENVLTNIHSIHGQVPKKVREEVHNALIIYCTEDERENPLPRSVSKGSFLISSKNLRPRTDVSYKEGGTSSTKPTKSSKGQTGNKPSSTASKTTKKGVVESAKGQSQNKTSSCSTSTKRTVEVAPGKTSKIADNTQPSSASNMTTKTTVVCLTGGRTSNSFENDGGTALSSTTNVVCATRKTPTILSSTSSSTDQTAIGSAAGPTSNIPSSAFTTTEPYVFECATSLTPNNPSSASGSTAHTADVDSTGYVVCATRKTPTSLSSTSSASDQTAIVSATGPTSNIPSSAFTTTEQNVFECATSLTPNNPSSASSSTAHTADVDATGSRQEISVPVSSQFRGDCDEEATEFLLLVDKNLETVINFSNTAVLTANEVTQAASHHLKYLLKLCLTYTVNFEEVVEHVKAEMLMSSGTAFPSTDFQNVLRLSSVDEKEQMDDNDEVSKAEHELDENVVDNKEPSSDIVFENKVIEILSSNQADLHALYSFTPLSEKVGREWYFSNDIRVFTSRTADESLLTCVLTMIMHSLRVHLMTTKLSNFDMSQHQLIYKMFVSNPDIEALWKILHSENHLMKYTGTRSLTFISKFLLEDFFEINNVQLNCLEGTVLMPSFTPKSKNKDIEEFNDFIAAKILDSLRFQSSDSKKVDPSLIFIDTLAATAVVNILPFPNRILIPLKGSKKSVVYQAIAALYKCMSTGSTGDQFMFRIVTRHSRSFGAEYVMLTLAFDSVYDHERQLYPIEILQSGITKKSSTFPNLLTRNNATYSLCGMILCLNAGQGILETDLAPVVSDNNVVLKTSAQQLSSHLYSLSDDELLGSYNGIYHISISDMKILNSTDQWYTDEILNAAMYQFVNFFDPGVVNDVVADVSVIHHLLTQLVDDPNASIAQRTQIVDVDSNLFAEAYTMSRALWKYENLFKIDNWFHTIVNYPENTHWVYVGIHRKEKVVLINDSIWNSYKMRSMINAVKEYIRSEDGYCDTIHDAIIGDFEGWQFRTEANVPQQRDMNNCGMFAFLSFMRVVFQSLDDFSEQTTPIFFDWSTTTTDIHMYRSLIKQLFFDDTRPSAVENFKEILLKLTTQKNKKRKT